MGTARSFGVRGAKPHPIGADMPTNVRMGMSKMNDANAS